MAKECFVYIHGVVTDVDRTDSHRDDYESLRTGLNAMLMEPLPALAQSVAVEWGFNHPDAGDTATLAQAQRVIDDRVEAATPSDRTTDLGGLLFVAALDPIRKLLSLGWSDIVYYVGEGGKHRVRNLIWGKLFDEIGVDEDTDLTIFGHSAGSLVAHDFLFWLFSGLRGDADFDELDGPSAADFAAATAHWRLRRLVTFGAPIAPMLIRSAAVTDILAGPGTPLLDADLLGVGRPSHAGPMSKWVNVWDRHDILSFPVAPFYDSDRVTDLYPDVSDHLREAHSSYWRSPKTHEAIAAEW